MSVDESTKVKAIEMLQPLSAPEWKWKHVSIDFIIELPRTMKGYKMISFIVDKVTNIFHTWKIYLYRKQVGTVVPEGSGEIALSTCVDCL